ncbi:MAG: magnesium and cobalt transport protein CorA, partial [Flavobacteriales bacterium]|nr:magnesium and cobalt transport protein CorA [Flavobacteriales bacterium]
MRLIPRLTKRRKIRVNSGLPPGTIVFTGKQKVKDVSIHYMEFDEMTVNNERCDPGEFLNVHRPTDKYVQWYDVRGLHDTDLIRSLGETFSLHPLVQEDIANTTQRPKYEEFEEGIF